MIRFKDFDITQDKEYNFFTQLYNNSFPLEERRSLDNLNYLLKNELKFKAKVIMNEANQRIGLLCFWTFDSFIYAEHLAIAPNTRSSGYGTQVVNAFLTAIKLPLILEIELPNDEMSIKRLKFYERLGFKIWDEIDYMQPSYHLTTNPVAMKLLTKGDIDLNNNYETVKNQLYREVYKVKGNL